MPKLSSLILTVLFVYSPSKVRSSMDSYRGDDEHRLIARYTACLASNSNGLVSHKNINLFT